MKLVQAVGTAPTRVIVTDGEKLEHLLRLLSDVTVVAVDCETTQGPKHLTHAVTVQLSWHGYDAIVVEPYLAALRPWVTKNHPTGIFYSAKGDLWALENAGLPWYGEVHDVMVMDYLLNENTKIRDFESGLKERYAEVFHRPVRPGYRDLFSVRGQGVLGADEVIRAGRFPELAAYGMQDARETWELYWNRRKALEQLHWAGDDSMWLYFLTYDAPYTKTLYRMERRGVLLDAQFLQECQREAEIKMALLEREFYRAVKDAGVTSGFTDKLMTSPKQLKELFYTTLKYPGQYNVDRETRERKLTTDEEALDVLTKKGFPLPRILLEHRSVAKLKNTYMDGLLEHLSPTGRIHTDFIQAFTLTGRLSSRKPNLQNIPRPENDQFGIREAFIASPGMVLVSLDYAQIETRLMAHMSGDEDLIRACESSDIYSAVAAEITGKPTSFFEEVDGKRSPEAKALRQGYKAIVLGVGFGKQAKSIAADLGISEAQAEEWLQSYFAKYPRFYAFMRKQIRECRDIGYVRTITGRYRRIPDIRSDNAGKRMHAERQALNSPIQGSAFDVIKKAQLDIEVSGILEAHQAYMVLQIHDEILFEVPRDQADAFVPKVSELMIHPFTQPLKVRLVVDGGYGQNWGVAK